MKRVLQALPALMLAISPVTMAHHSGAMFDSTKSLTLTGTVTEFDWRNPHASFKVDVVGTDGKHVVWAVEMNAPQNLVLEGWKRTTIKAGDKVTFTVRPLRDGKPGGSFMSITLPDGTKLGGTGPGDNLSNAPAGAATAPRN